MNLIDRITKTRIDAGERAVIEDLKAKGLDEQTLKEIIGTGSRSAAIEPASSRSGTPTGEGS